MRHTSKNRRALTLVEMLVGMAITLIMMAAVVNLFANVSGGVSNRRAAIEMNGTLRQARSLLQRDLAGATCPAVPWQNPEAGNGYLEIIEGQWSDSRPSALIDGVTANGELDYATSIIPSSQRVDTTTGAITDGGGLGDYDDILALTVRSDNEPFVGNTLVWNNLTSQWQEVVVESNLAEVIWYSIENPSTGTLGEPGLRTIYRRVLLIAPWLGAIDLNSQGGSNPPAISPTNNSDQFFQRLDISAHFDATSNRWIPNTLSDLTKRENRFLRNPTAPLFPHPLLSSGSGFGVNSTVTAGSFRSGLDSLNNDATVRGITNDFGQVTDYVVLEQEGGEYDAMPSIAVTGGATNPTPRAVVQRAGSNSNIWKIAHVTNGPSPLSFSREGEDVILSDVLAWDIRVFDPEALLTDSNASGTVVGPGDYGWSHQAGSNIGYQIVGQGDYVNLDYWDQYVQRWRVATGSNGSPPVRPPATLFSEAVALRSQLANFGYAVYDTWSTHYESDGIDQSNRDGDNDLTTGADEGTNGFDDIVAYDLDNDPNTPLVVPLDVNGNPTAINGTDDVGEHETSPPYDVKLPAVKVIMRAYERDSRQIRETSVTQSFQ